MGEDVPQEGMLGVMVCVDLDLAMVSPGTGTGTGTGSNGPDRRLKVVAWRVPLPAL